MNLRILPRESISLDKNEELRKNSFEEKEEIVIYPKFELYSSKEASNQQEEEEEELE